MNDINFNENTLYFCCKEVQALRDSLKSFDGQLSGFRSLSSELSSEALIECRNLIKMYANKVDDLNNRVKEIKDTAIKNFPSIALLFNLYDSEDLIKFGQLDDASQNYKILERNYLGKENLYRITVEGSKYPIVVYIPNVVTDDTAIHCHYKGSLDGDIQNTAKNFAEYGGTSIVLMPDIDYRAVDEIIDTTVKAIEAIQKEFGIKSLDLSFSGWSGGTIGATVAFITCVNYFDIEGTPVISLLDDVSELRSDDENYQYSRKYFLNNGGADAFRRYNPIIMSVFEEKNSVEYWLENGNYEKAMEIVDETFGERDEMMIDFAKEGAICVRARISNPVVTSSVHKGIKDNMYLSGIQDFSDGHALLPDETQNNEYLVLTNEKAKYTYELLVGVDEMGDGIWKEMPYEYASTKVGIKTYSEMNPFNSDGM